MYLPRPFVLASLPFLTYCASPPNIGQLATDLPGLNRYITTHNAAGKAVIQSSAPAQWLPLANNTAAFDVVYTTSTFPVNMKNDADILAHSQLYSKGPVPLALPGGTVCRIIDLAPGSVPLMHRTQSLDYGVVLEGDVEMQLDGGEKKSLGRGDVAVMRGTEHAWKNTGKGWCRIFFVLVGAEKVDIGGRLLEEDVPPIAGL